MFAKVFEQIFDSSIATDYTVRHMFIDMLILADPTGAVDMTLDAIARRTNVPPETVKRCIDELCQPDVTSRSPLEDGKRLIPLDSHRDWGWKIVNYQHYRKIRDQEARRSYFRDYQRKRRKKERRVKDTVVNSGANGDRVEISSSTSSSLSASMSVREKRRCTEQEAIDYCTIHNLTKEDGEWFWNKCEGCGWKNNKESIQDWKRTIIAWSKIKIFPSQKQYGTNQKRGTQGGQGVGRGVGTLNEGTSSQYRGVGKIGEVPNPERPATGTNET